MSAKKIQIIGDRFEVMRYPLKWRGITIENIISACNPIAMAGYKEQEIIERCERANSVAMQLMTKGNLAQMLSREEKEFCDNSKYLAVGQSTRYKNESEYIIVCNDLCGYELYSYRGGVYSNTYPEDDLLGDIVNQSGCTALSLPYTSFDWKKHYDEFIDAILGAYDGEHIILIRTNVMRWYQRNGGFIAFDEDVRALRNQIEQMDAYFADRTDCHCIDAMYACVPNNAPYAFDMFPYRGPKSTPYTLKCAARTSPFYKEIEYALDEIINQGSMEYKKRAYKYKSPIVQKLYSLLSEDVLERNQRDLTVLESREIETLCELDGGSEFISNLRKLSRFIEGEQRYSLADYITECQEGSLSKCDYHLLALAVAYLKMGMDEIISLYQLYQSCEDHTPFRTIVSNICANRDCYPLKSTARLVRRNVGRLSHYQYVESGLPLLKPHENYIRLDDGSLLLLNADADEPMRLIHTDVKEPQSVDYKRVIADNYVCAIGEAYALCCDWGFYIARAREGKGGYPVTIRFDSPEKFALSLAYVDYTDLLESEPFILSCTQPLEAFPIENYQTRCNLDFLFDKSTRIAFEIGGVGEQTGYYLFSKWIEENIGGRFYYDDIAVEGCGSHSGMELHKIIAEDITERRFSNIFSPKLISRMRYRSVADRLYLHGLEELFGVISDKHRRVYTNASPHVYIPQSGAENLYQVARYGIPYYFGHINHSSDMGVIYAKKYLKLSNLLPDSVNKETIERMLACDAIVLHVRRGDFVSLGWDTDTAFYQEAMAKLKGVPDYPNKKFFVFSDDIPWCKENLAELGFDLFPDADITFVDFNRGDHSIQDLRLMSLGKVLIGSGSSFFGIAATLADNCEVLMCPEESMVKQIERNIRKNKYDIGVFSKNYATDLSSRTPKTERKN